MSAIKKHFKDPDPDSIGNNVYEFLEFLGGPATILLQGKDTQRTRALVTLLHGNEPSGIYALFRWLKSGKKPAVNILCIIASVAAASSPPAFSQRVLSPHRDLNRCFKPPFDDEQGKLASSILQTLKDYSPEAAIDMHNTSGSGPAFGVATHMDQQHDALASLFTRRLVITHLRLGALMEISEYLCPTVTIECGGRLDPQSHDIAWEGMQHYFGAAEVLSSGEQDCGLEILNNPVRLELRPDCEFYYAHHENNPLTTSKKIMLVLDPAIEQLNNGITRKDTFLGWANFNKPGDIFSSKNSDQRCILDKMLYIKNGRLLTRQDLKLFMVTSNPEIARMDCLFYAVKSNGQEINH